MLFWFLMGIGFFMKGQVPVDYQPVLKDGKIWILEPEKCLYPNSIPYFVRVSVAGDTIMDNRLTYILEELSYYSNREELEVRYVTEEDKKLFYLNTDSVWCPLMDFNPSPGERTMDYMHDGQLYPGWEVREAGVIFLGDGYHRYLKMPNYDYWIEGVGSVYQNYLTTTSEEVPIGGSVFPVLSKCFDNDNLIFDKREFEYFSQVKDIGRPIGDKERIIYDLHGRVVTATVPGSIYIRDGRKFVAK